VLAFPSLSLGLTPSVGGKNHQFSLVWEEWENQKKCNSLNICISEVCIKYKLQLSIWTKKLMCMEYWVATTHKKLFDFFLHYYLVHDTLSHTRQKCWFLPREVLQSDPGCRVRSQYRQSLPLLSHLHALVWRIGYGFCYLLYDFKQIFFVQPKHGRLFHYYPYSMKLSHSYAYTQSEMLAPLVALWLLCITLYWANTIINSFFNLWGGEILLCS